MTEMDWAVILILALAAMNLFTLHEKRGLLEELRKANEGWRASHGAWMASEAALKIFGVQLERLQEGETGEIPATPEPDQSALH
jgi:hypothetical protein